VLSGKDEIIATLEGYQKALKEELKLKNQQQSFLQGMHTRSCHSALEYADGR
jgi:hypothetical protein